MIEDKEEVEARLLPVFQKNAKKIFNLDINLIVNGLKAAVPSLCQPALH